MLSKIQALSPYLSTPKSRTRRRISCAGLNVSGRSPVQPVAGTGAAPGKGAWPAKPAGWSNWSPKELMNAASSNRTSPAVPMKFVATPRPDRNDRKSIVGPWMLALRPPAHSTWATLRPSRSADWAIDSACRTFGAKDDVELPNGWPLMWNVLFVEPWTPGQAPVARVYQPAPVFGGAWVRRPPPVAEAPFLRKSAIVGMTPWPAYFWTRSWRRPSDAKKTALSVGAFALPAAFVAPEADPRSGAAVADVASRPNRSAATINKTMGRTRTCATLSSSSPNCRHAVVGIGRGAFATAASNGQAARPSLDRTPSLCDGKP